MIFFPLKLPIWQDAQVSVRRTGSHKSVIPLRFSFFRPIEFEPVLGGILRPIRLLLQPVQENGGGMLVNPLAVCAMTRDACHSLREKLRTSPVPADLWYRMAAQAGVYR
jgi:hypothetical protein